MYSKTYVNYNLQAINGQKFLRAACHESVQLATEIEKHQDTLHASTEI